VSDIAQTKILLTLVDGKEVYRALAFNGVNQ